MEKKNLGAVLTVVIESFCYIVMQYVLASAIISFRRSVLFVVFFAVNVFVISKYLETLEKYVSRRPVQYGLLALCLVIPPLFACSSGSLAGELIPFS